MSTYEPFDYAAYIAAREKTLHQRASVLQAAFEAAVREPLLRILRSVEADARGVQRGREGRQ